MTVYSARALVLGAFAGLGGPAFGAALTTQPATFAQDVAPILQAKCQDCHRKGSSAPMSLVSYEETRPWAKAIKQRVLARTMPPWHLDKTSGSKSFRTIFR